jgi:hypothetical protein
MGALGLATSGFPQSNRHVPKCGSLLGNQTDPHFEKTDVFLSCVSQAISRIFESYGLHSNKFKILSRSSAGFFCLWPIFRRSPQLENR